MGVLKMDHGNSILLAENILKKYGNKIVLNTISFDVIRGEFLSVLGPSGCGKTTLLRCLIGIEEVDSGSFIKNGEDITHLPPQQRNMGIVFQNYALFPNMTIFQNIAYALKARKLSKDEIEEKVRKIVADVGLEDHINKKPRQLSGGQQQRVAIARTLVLNPDIVLFDEPMSALDTDIKMSLRKLIKKIQSERKITMIYITHDQEEAFSLSDRIMVMRDGAIEQMGTPKDIYYHPKDEFVKSFIVNNLDEKVRLIQSSIQ